jgi:hypothetical protein
VWTKEKEMKCQRKVVRLLAQVQCDDRGFQGSWAACLIYLMYRVQTVQLGEIVPGRAMVDQPLRSANDWRDPSREPVLTILTVWRR